MKNEIVTMDVRSDIRQGREPFQRIISAVSALTQDQRLLLLAPFQPVPLFRVMEARGFDHKASQLDSGDWEVLFTRTASRTASPPDVFAPLTPLPASLANDQTTIELDLRGLEPPQPLVRILEALSTLPPEARLTAHTDRRPIHLYPELATRGFAAYTEESAAGGFLSQITRA